MWLGIACLVVATGTAGGAYLYFHESVAAVAAKTPEVKRAARAARRRASGPAGGRARDRLRPSQGGRPEHVGPLGHADARPRRPRVRLDLPPLVPTRHARRDPLPGPHTVLRQDQRGLFVLRAAGLAADRARSDRRPDQLPDHGQLPRLPADRRPPRRRLDRRRPPLLQRPAAGPYGYAKINLQPGYQQLTAARRSTTSATGTPTPTSTASPGSSSS